MIDTSNLRNWIFEKNFNKISNSLFPYREPKIYLENKNEHAALPCPRSDWYGSPVSPTGHTFGIKEIKSQGSSVRSEVTTTRPEKKLTILYTISMMSLSNNIFRVTGPLRGESTGNRLIPPQRPLARSFHVFFDLRLDKRLGKQLRRWWFETPSRSLWRHSNCSITFFNETFSYFIKLSMEFVLMVELTSGIFG